MGRLTVLGRIVVVVGALAILGGGGFAAYKFLFPHEDGIPGFDGNPVSSVPPLPDAAPAATAVASAPVPPQPVPAPATTPTVAPAIAVPAAPVPALPASPGTPLAGSQDAPAPGAALQDLVGGDAAACTIDLSAIVADSVR